MLNRSEIDAFLDEKHVVCFNQSSKKVTEENYKEDETFDCAYPPEFKFKYALLTKNGKYSSSEKTTAKTKMILAIFATIVFGLIMVNFMRRFILTCLHPEQAHFSSSMPIFSEITAVPFAGNGGGDASNGVGAHGGRRKALNVRDATLIVISCRIKELENMPEDAMCAICLEDIKQADVGKISRFPCKHVYHEDCAFQWIRKGSPSCPCCFYDLSGDVVKLRDESSKSNNGQYAAAGEDDDDDDEGHNRNVNHNNNNVHHLLQHDTVNTTGGTIGGSAYSATSNSVSGADIPTTTDLNEQQASSTFTNMQSQ